jgi:hypothetical protein
MGTNGEFLLALADGGLLAASVPLGPALEGIGLTHGNVAGPGAVTRFALSPAGLEARTLDGAAPSRAAGLTGTAYLSLLAHLVRLGLVNAQGQFRPGATPLGARLAERIEVRGGERVFTLFDGMALSGADVEEVLKVKAAFNLALSRLLARSGAARRGPGGPVSGRSPGRPRGRGRPGDPGLHPRRAGHPGARGGQHLPGRGAPAARRPAGPGLGRGPARAGARPGLDGRPGFRAGVRGRMRFSFVP